MDARDHLPTTQLDAERRLDTDRLDTDRLDTDRLDTDRLDTDRPLDAEAPLDADGGVTLHAERLVADHETREWARVKVTKRIVVEEKTFTVPVRREELVIEYPDGTAPWDRPNPVHGSTDIVHSEVRHEFVLHEEVPHVTVETRPYEKVQFIVDTQRGMVELSDQVRHEHLTVDHLGSGERLLGTHEDPATR